jgi:adenosylcobinamide kinase/adenosylcobinamide-phosphate guanylyltransferase
MQSRLILIGGGARSGKSAFAVNYARRLHGQRFFLATAQPFDDEMRARIARHREERGAEFQTVEEPLNLAAALERVPAAALVLVDCLTLWLSNLLLAERSQVDILAAVDELARVARCRAGPTLLVTNEVGMSLVPDNALGRVFRDVAGLCHQRLAAAADETYAAMMGLVLRLHPAPLQTFRSGEIP